MTVSLSGYSWGYRLTRGHSNDPSEGACAMDAVNWLVHGKHGDQPECACAVIGAFVITGNDDLGAADRQRLLGYLHRIAGSRSLEHRAERARLMVRDALRATLAEMLDPRDLAIVRLPATDRMVARLRRLPVDPTIAQMANAMDYRDAYAVGGSLREAVDNLRFSQFKDAASRAAGRILASTGPDAYFATLDAALTAGPQGEPWSANTVALGEALYAAASKQAAARDAVPA